MLTPSPGSGSLIIISVVKLGHFLIAFTYSLRTFGDVNTNVVAVIWPPSRNSFWGVIYFFFFLTGDTRQCISDYSPLPEALAQNPCSIITRYVLNLVVTRDDKDSFMIFISDLSQRVIQKNSGIRAGRARFQTSPLKNPHTYRERERVRRVIHCESNAASFH